MNRKEEYKFIMNVLSDKTLYAFITKNLRQSLSSIGYSKKFIESLISNLINIDVKEFCRQHNSEIKKVQNKLFFGIYVPEYFSRYVVPEISDSKVVVDVGCGPATLVRLLSKQKRFQKIIGIDIQKYPEWKSINNPKVGFKIAKEKEFFSLINELKPSSVTFTWTLHHMKYEEQERYMKRLSNSLFRGSSVVILEDSYSSKLEPQNGIFLYREFMKLKSEDKKKVMSFYDWIANRILERRDRVPIPFTFRTAEEWQNLFEKVGFRIEKRVFIGFPNYRDINTPQSLIVLRN